MEPAPHVDIDERFRRELRDAQLPTRISLHGNPMLTAVAALLLKKHAPDIEITDDGDRVELMSMEAFGARFLGTFMEEQDPPADQALLMTIPESELVAYARRHSVPVVEEERDDVRRMLDRIAAQQPQTYFSLARSGQRLSSAAERLRREKRK